MNFSKRLKELREKKGLSQEQLAERLDIPRTTINHYENDDDRIPRQNRLNQIADFFGVSVDYLVGRANNKELNESEKSFLSDIDQLSIEELKEKHLLTVDGKPASKEEIEGAIAFIRSLRDMK
jgi:transcriptional regulator with XRE-family HTH domain